MMLRRKNWTARDFFLSNRALKNTYSKQNNAPISKPITKFPKFAFRCRLLSFFAAS
jgi:hypothetical protein